MRQEEVVVDLWDAKRLLSSGEYEETRSLQATLDHGYHLYPWAEQRYHQLWGTVRARRKKELADLMADAYREELKQDESLLGGLSTKEPLLTKDAALHFFTAQFPNLETLMRHEPGNWLPQSLDAVQEDVTRAVSEAFQDLMKQVQHPDAFGHTPLIWMFMIPRANYVKYGLDTLELTFQPYAAVTIQVWREEHQREFYDWVLKMRSSDGPVAQINKLLIPQDLDVAPPKLTVPLDLLTGLASGCQEPPECEIVRQLEDRLTYRVAGFGDQVTLTSRFVDFLTALKQQSPVGFLESLSKLGILGELAYRVLRGKISMPHAGPEVGEKVKKYLETIHNTAGHLSYGQWGRVLGLTREGAFRLLGRLETMGLVVREKHEAGEGIRVFLTKEGLAAIWTKKADEATHAPEAASSRGKPRARTPCA